MSFCSSSTQFEQDSANDNGDAVGVAEVAAASGAVVTTRSWTTPSSLR